ncbi:sulfatase-like hydrolase/transferase [Candidatus Fermentibacteria bacterium]|nr:sulfatase-like hydrolase/transferase [Candidatus Fermentibacteria bacterium]
MLLIVIDTFRADHMGCYGYPRNTTPHLDSLADEGIVYSRMQSQSSWTLPAVASILTGLPPRLHMAGKRNDIYYGLDPELPYLPRTMSQHGYRTAAFLNVVYLNSGFGFHQGFEHFDCEGLVKDLGIRKAGETVDDCLEWMDTLKDGDRFFILMHLYDPHLPYDPPPPYDTLFTSPAYQGEYDSDWGSSGQLVAVNIGEVVPEEEDVINLINLYDGELAYTDTQAARLLSELRKRGYGGNTLVMVTADHGEEFFDHGGMEHGHTLYQELLNVPLVVSGPGISRDEVSELPVCQLDVLPMVHNACGFQLPDPVEDYQGRPPPRNRFVPSSGLLWSVEPMAGGVLNSLKVIWLAESDTALCFDLSSDPYEQSPIEVNQQLLQRVMDYWALPPRGEPRPIEYEETIDPILEDLGYVR